MSDDNTSLLTQTSRSLETKKLIKEKALEHGKIRSDNIRDRIFKEIKLIEDHVAKSGGAFPKYEKIPSINEIARRAGVHPTTIFGEKHRETYNCLKTFLAQLKQVLPVENKTVCRRPQEERIAEWKKQYQALQQNYHDTELLLQDTESKLEATLKKVEALTNENLELHARQKILVQIK